MAMKFALYGGREMKANMERLAKKSPKSMERALKKFGEIEMAEMKRRIPVDTGTARDSGFVGKPEWQANTLTIELGFGGAAEDYIIPLHENLDVYHPNGEAKFVESVLSESEPHFAERVLTDWAKDMGLL